jgi:hypothetical protein
MGGGGCGEWMLKGKRVFVMVECGPAGQKHSVMQKLSAALSCWFVEYACMKKRHSKEHHS